MEQILLDKLVFTQLVKKFPKFITTFTRACHCFRPWNPGPDTASPQLSTLFPMILSNIIYPPTPRSYKTSLPFRFSDQYSVYISHPTHVCYMFYLSHQIIISLFCMLKIRRYRPVCPPAQKSMIYKKRISYTCHSAETQVKYHQENCP